MDLARHAKEQTFAKSRPNDQWNFPGPNAELYFLTSF